MHKFHIGGQVLEVEPTGHDTYFVDGTVFTKDGQRWVSKKAMVHDDFEKLASLAIEAFIKQQA